MRKLARLAATALFLAGGVHLVQAEEVNARVKADSIMRIEPIPVPRMTPRQMLEADKALRDLSKVQERLRWMFKVPKKIDSTGRLQFVPGLWHWAV